MNPHPIYAVHAVITNKLADGIHDGMQVAGIIGSNPSTSARSPTVWNRVFGEFGMDAHYCSFDVATPEDLPKLLEVLRTVDGFLGGNVTVPYKTAIIEHLDEVDPKAKAIGAVNTIVRTHHGTLKGYNTDGQGAVDNLLLVQPGRAAPVVHSLAGKRVLLLGAGGAAKATAFFLADALAPKGVLTIANRTIDGAHALAAAVRAYQPSITVTAIAETDVELACLHADVIFNATSKGQGGILTHGSTARYLEPYSALAPADVAVVPRGEESPEDFARSYIAQAMDSIIANNRTSLSLATKIPSTTIFVDAVHTPKESVFLLHGRLTGHQTINGVGMNVGQALDAFYNKVMKDMLVLRGMHTEDMRTKIREVMSR